VAKRLTTTAAATSAYQAQWQVLTSWWQHIPEPCWQQSSAVDAWRVSDLIAHFGLVADSIVAAAGSSTREPALTISDYLLSYAEVADGIDARTREVGNGRDGVMEFVAKTATKADASLRSSISADPVVAARRGPIRWSDFLATRCVELAVHSDDLRRSLSGTSPTTERSCEKLAVRALAGVLEKRAPGRSVEVRIPPYAAIQCVPGPRHTRGTPAAVVEMSPTTFLRIAAGRVSWAKALGEGEVSASGERADLQELLPLLS
jgi:uncharacterized protein (TIGR03083 family)